MAVAPLSDLMKHDEYLIVYNMILWNLSTGSWLKFMMGLRVNS